MLICVFNSQTEGDMRKIFVISQFLLLGCFSGVLAVESQRLPLNVKIIQGAKTYSTQSGKVRIKKAPFTFLFTFHYKPIVQINFSKDDWTMKAVLGGMDAAYIPPFQPGSGMAEEVDGSSKYLIVDNEGFHYWFHTSEKETRFSKCFPKDGYIQCRKDIHFIFEPVLRKDIPIGQYEGNHLAVSILYRDEDRNRLTFVHIPGVLQSGENNVMKNYLQWYFSHGDYKDRVIPSIMGDSGYFVESYEEHQRTGFLIQFEK